MTRSRKVLLLGLTFCTLSLPACYRRDPAVSDWDPSGNFFSRSYVADGQGSNGSNLFQESNTKVGEISFEGRGANALMGGAGGATAQNVPVSPSIVAPQGEGSVTQPAASVTPQVPGATVADHEQGMTRRPLPEAVSGQFTNTENNISALRDRSVCADTNGRLPGDWASSESNDPRCFQPRDETLMQTRLQGPAQAQGSTTPGVTSSAGR